MEEKTNNIANQTEIPVTDLSKAKNKLSLPKIDKKILIGIGILIAVFLVGILIAVFLNKPAKSPVVVSKEYELAYNAGDYKKAEQVANEILAKNSTNLDANTGALNAIAAQGNSTGTETEALKKAQPYIEELTKNKDNNLAALLAVGYAYETAGQYDTALEYYGKAIELYPKASDAWFRWGHLMQFMGREEDAKKAYNTAYSFDPTHPLVQLVLAKEYLADGNVNEAWTMYRKVINNPLATNSVKAEAYSAASQIALGRGAYMEALSIAKQAVETDPNSSLAQGVYGYCLAITDSPDQGIAALKKAIELNPRLSRNYSDLAQVYRAEGNFIEAINYQKMAIEKLADDNTILNPQSKIQNKGYYTYDLAKTYDMAGITNGVLPLLQNAISLYPDMRSRLKHDIDDNNLFSTYSNNSDFNNLLNG